MKGKNVSTKRLGRTVGAALLGGALLTTGGLFAAASPATAAPGDGGTGSITVYKLEQPDGPIGPNDGSQLDTTGTTPLVAGFTICSIDDFDLSVSGNWDRLASMSVTQTGTAKPVVTENGTELAMTCGVEQTTAEATGATTFSDLPADRAYVVYESSAPTNALYTSQPALLTVPYPGTGTGETWNYNPHIYPKNTLSGSGASKTGEIVGHDVTFEVTVPLNPLGDGKTYSQLKVDDQLDASLQYTNGGVQLQTSSGTKVALVENEDYTLTAPASGTPGQKVTLDFLDPAGLAKLNANIGGKVILVIDAEAIATGTTENEATITINGKATDPGTGPSVVDPEPFYSGVHIVKQAKNKGATANVPLAGAKFDVYTAENAATVCEAEPTGVKVLSNQESDASGNTPDAVLAAGTYCVYEVAVPAGYKGLVGGQLLQVTGASSATTVVNTQIGADEGDLPFLPMTGGQGSALVIMTGGALLAVGIALVLMRRKRSSRA